MNIGIEKHTSLVYEASSAHGYPVWPSPVLLQAVIASEEEVLFTAAKRNELLPHSLIFREDDYNSSSRIRRGRLYKAGGTQPVKWHVYPHPAIAHEVGQIDRNGGRPLEKDVYAFSSLRLWQHLKTKQCIRPVFVLGAEDASSVWTLVNIETSATGDELVVLRARKSIGALPQLDRAKILAADGKAVFDQINKLEQELFRAGPESIVDRSREAITAILSKYLQAIGRASPGDDLARLAKKIAEEKFEVAGNAASIVARLHARGKNAEQERRPIRPINEQDAEFAVQAVGVILCDLGWAHWSLSDTLQP